MNQRALSGPERRRARTINLAVITLMVVGVVALGVKHWIDERSKELGPGEVVAAWSSPEHYRLAAFNIPGGAVEVRVSAPRGEVAPGGYGEEVPRVRRGNRFVGVDIVVGEGVRPESVEVTLISDGERYELDPSRDESVWVVVKGDARGLAVELSHDGERQRHDLDSGEHEAGLAAGLMETYRAPTCEVVATNPAGRTVPVQQLCPEVSVTASTWDERSGWVESPTQRWVTVTPPEDAGGRDLFGRLQRISMDEDPQMLVNGSSARPRQGRGVALMEESPAVVEVQYPAHVGGDRGWTLRARIGLEKVAG